MRSLSMTLLVSLALSFGMPAFAEPPANANGTPYAIGGYDVVAYFTDKRPVRGVQAHAARYGGATWLFASAEHKRQFERAPESFFPAYLGYCAYGVAQNRLVPIDPQAWTVRDGRLYLNHSLEVRQRWSRDPAGYIEQANRNWPTLSR